VLEHAPPAACRVRYCVGDSVCVLGEMDGRCHRVMAVCKERDLCRVSGTIGAHYATGLISTDVGMVCRRRHARVRTQIAYSPTATRGPVDGVDAPLWVELLQTDEHDRRFKWKELFPSYTLVDLDAMPYPLDSRGVCKFAVRLRRADGIYPQQLTTLHRLLQSAWHARAPSIYLLAAHGLNPAASAHEHLLLNRLIGNCYNATSNDDIVHVVSAACEHFIP
jgi:hypothetical protein